MLDTNSQLKINDKVVFNGCSKDQINWGSNDDPNPILKIGETYTIINVDVHSQHTKIMVKGYVGKFNSVCFEKL
jgi:hypothetical protein